jgi:hypothetical protein
VRCAGGTRIQNVSAGHSTSQRKHRFDERMRMHALSGTIASGKRWEIAHHSMFPPTYEAYCCHTCTLPCGENLSYSGLHFFSSREHRTFGNTHFLRGIYDTLIELASASDRSSSYSSTRHVKQRGRTVGDRARREQR